MKCNDVQFMILQNEDAGLAPEAKEHVSSCSSCAAFESAQKRFTEARLDEVPSSDLDRSIMDMARRTEQAERVTGSALMLFPRTIWLAAAAAILLALGIYFLPDKKPVSVSTQVAVVDKPVGEMIDEANVELSLLEVMRELDSSPERVAFYDASSWSESFQDAIEELETDLYVEEELLRYDHVEPSDGISDNMKMDSSPSLS